MRRSTRHRSRGARRKFAAAAAAVVAGTCLGMAPPAHAGDWGFAAEAGPILAAASGTPFVFRLTPYNMLAPEFSLGPTAYISPAGDALMYATAFLAQFHAEWRSFAVVPFLGIGVAHRRSENDNSTAVWFPLGSSFDVPVGERLFVRATLSGNIHSIELDGEDDNLSLGLTFGINYKP